MDNITSKVYAYMKIQSEKNGFVPTVRQTADQLNLIISEVEGVVNKMQQLG